MIHSLRNLARGATIGERMRRGSVGSGVAASELTTPHAISNLPSATTAVPCSVASRRLDSDRAVPSRPVGRGAAVRDVVAQRWYALEVAPGLEPIVRDEVETCVLDVHGWSRRVERPDTDMGPVQLSLPRGALHDRDLDEALTSLRTVQSVWSAMQFRVPRPKALLGDQACKAIEAEVRRVVEARAHAFHAVRVHAAGKESAVMRRIAETVGRAVSLPVSDEGDLHLRIAPMGGPAVDALVVEGLAGGRTRAPASKRHEQTRTDGWRVEVRLTPRPSSVRPWRVVDLPGGLDACVAAAAWRIVGIRPEARILNLMCGGGTFLAERHLAGPARSLVGVDLDPLAVDAARRNLAAAGRNGVDVQCVDARQTGFPSASFDQIVVDPPWGDAVGHARQIRADLPAWLSEARRLLVSGGDLVVVTHAIRAFDDALAREPSMFEERRRLRVWQGGHRPALVHLVAR